MKRIQTPDDYLKGRGAQSNTSNRFLKQTYVQEHPEGIDVEEISNDATTFMPEYPKKIVNAVNSPDVPLDFSANPYQGCEHGCIYCYARPVHEYWGLSAGLDFERKIIVKHNAPELLAQHLESRSWKPAPIMLSGNTDCYQPAERKFELTRKMLQVLLEYKNPVGIITKNSLILRDLDILKALAAENLVHVMISITTVQEALRQVMEPRTASTLKKLSTIKELTDAGIPTGVMMAPVIPGLTAHEIPELMAAAAKAGACEFGYTMLRLNGSVAELFTDWIRQTFPDRADKVLRQVAKAHGGQLGDMRFGTRMRGQGDHAQAIRDLFKINKKKYFKNRRMPPYNLDAFIRKSGKQLTMF